MTRSTSRYTRVSTRAKSTAVRGSFFLSVAALSPGLACGNNDADILSATTTTEPTSTTGTAPTSTLGSDEATSTVVVDESTATSSDEASASVGETAQMQIDFTFAAEGERLHNPYVAVWIENADGDLVDTVAVWYQQDQKGKKWIDDLKRWYAVSDRGSNGAEISSATRTPGDYSLLWDGTDGAGAKVPQGSYFVCIEAAREHGPYELIRESLTLGADGFSLELPDADELLNASVVFSA